jgi:hypothetical protein
MFYTVTAKTRRNIVYQRYFDQLFSINKIPGKARGNLHNPHQDTLHTVQ